MLLRMLVLALMLAAGLGGGAHAQGVEIPATVMSQAESSGHARVIVLLDVAMQPEARLGPAQAQAQAARLSTVQDEVLNRLSAHQALRDAGVRRFATVPGFAATLTPQALQALAQDPAVRAIQEDGLNRPFLNESTGIVQATQAWDYGLQGQGQVVAVLDTGVDKNHPFLVGKTVSEACYSTNFTGPDYTVTSLCPGGATSSTAVNSGLHCTGIVGCDHGTHVAGIAVGGNPASGAGVAPGAGLIGMQVFSRFEGPGISCNGGPPCISAYDSDIIAGLERVYALRTTYDIASVNLSLGGGRYFDYCDGSLMKPVIDNLRAAGIATVIATGNNGWANSVSSPACISSAVSVGSTTKDDDLSGFSNSAPMVDLLAPGSSILSSVTPGTGFAFKNGTSMATPHVAGAWAVIKSHDPALTVDEIEEILKATGTPVTDTLPWTTDPEPQYITRGRINIRAAVALQRSLEELAAVDGDFGDDARADLMIRDNANGTLWLYQMNGPVAQSAGAVRTPAGQAVSLPVGALSQGLGDFNGMGRMDLLLRDEVTGDLSMRFFSGSTQVYDEPAGSLALAWAVAGVGDFDGDGRDDILIRNQNTGQLWVYLMDGGTRIGSQNAGALALAWRVEQVADLDGDGKADILIRNQSTGQLWVLLMDGGTRIGSQNAQALPLDWVVIGAGDFDGDGRADILIRNGNALAPNVGQLWLFRMNGGTRLASLNVGALDPLWQVAKVADFGGDGRVDLLLRHQNTAQLWLFQMNGAVRAQSHPVTSATVPAGWTLQ